MKRSVYRPFITFFLVLLALLAGSVKPCLAGHWEVTYETNGGVSQTIPKGTGIQLLYLPVTNSFDRTQLYHAGASTDWYALEKYHVSTTAVLTWAKDSPTDTSTPPSKVWALEQGWADAMCVVSDATAPTYHLDDGLGDPDTTSWPPADGSSSVVVSGEHVRMQPNPGNGLQVNLPTRSQSAEIKDLVPPELAMGGVYTSTEYAIKLIDFSLKAFPAIPVNGSDVDEPDLQVRLGFADVGWKSVSTDSEFPDRPYYCGRLALFATATIAGAPTNTNIYPGQRFLWTADPAPIVPDPYLPPQVIWEENLPEASGQVVSEKHFYYDFGSDPSVFPLDTTVRLNMTGNDGTPVGPNASAVIHWYCPPGLNLPGVTPPPPIPPGLDPNDPDYGEMVLIDQYQTDYQTFMKTGLDDLNRVITVYIEIAKFYELGPVYTIGTHAALSLGAKAVEMAAATQAGKIAVEVLEQWCAKASSVIDRCNVRLTDPALAANVRASMSARVEKLKDALAAAKGQILSAKTLISKGEEEAAEAARDKEIAANVDSGVSGTRPPNEIMPADVPMSFRGGKLALAKNDAGEWEVYALRGDCIFKVTRADLVPFMRMKDGTPVAGIRFYNGWGDFTPLARESVPICMTGSKNSKIDRKAANIALAAENKWTEGQAAKYMKDNNLEWHHHYDRKTMMAIPKEINQHVPHEGGAALVRQFGPNWP